MSAGEGGEEVQEEAMNSGALLPSLSSLAGLWLCRFQLPEKPVFLVLMLISGFCFAGPPLIVTEDGKYLGRLSANPYHQDSVSNPFGYGNPYRWESIRNEFGPYGNPYSPDSVTNPYAVPRRNIWP